MPPKYYKKNYFKPAKTGAGGGGGGGPRKSSSAVAFQKTGSFLVIVESPSKCQAIESYLGTNYNVIASKGHLCSLDHLKDIDTKNAFETVYHPIPGKLDHIQFMKSVISQYPKQNIILATDDDREGTAIAYHICRMFDLPVETTKLIKFNEITKTALQRAIQTPQTIDMCMVQSQQARQILDVLIGFKISPFLWKYLYHSKSNNLSAGRCQTPALRLVYENYQELQRRERERKYKTTGVFFQSHRFVCELNCEFDTPDQVRQFLQDSITHKHTFTVGDKKESIKPAPKPLNTSKLLQASSNVLHISPKSTMALAQTLYQSGHITYMRSENTKYSQDFLNVMETYIQTRYDTKYKGNFEMLINIDSKNPHEGIRVTNPALESIQTDEPKLAALYRLIWKHTLESCMADARYNTHKITIDAPQDKTYTHTIEIPVFLGWKIISETKKSIAATTGIQQAGSTTLYSIQPGGCSYHGGVAPLQQIDSVVVVRNKHQHYTESSLIQKLEELEIGRPSTFAVFLETIRDRGYVEIQDIEGSVEQCHNFQLSLPSSIQETIEKKTFGNEKNKLVLTPVGLLCIEFLLKHFDPLFAYHYTKQMEEELDTIAKGIANPWYQVCQSTLIHIQELAKPIAKLEKQEYPINDTHTLVFQSFGSSIKYKNKEGKIEYLPVKKEVVVDVEKLKKKEYRLEDLAEYTNPCLGEYQGMPLVRKTGQYGTYVEWGDKRQSLEPLGPHPSVEMIVALLDEEEEKETSPKTEDTHKSILRVINDDCSIRLGKYGHYVYYRTAEMKNPRFLNLKKFPEKYLDCSIDVLLSWLKTIYKL